LLSVSKVIDLHCHILPGFDDGPKTAGESLQMVRIFLKAGYNKVVATPHLVTGTTWMPSLKRIRDRLAELNQIINDEGLEFDVLPGMEIAFDAIIPDLLNQRRLLTIAETSYLLIEPPFRQLPLGWEQAVFAILSKGYFILMAHPERCAQLATRPQLADRLVESGVYLQVNWASFLGYHGRAALQTAYRLAESGHIHCLATDSHNPHERHAAHVRLAAAKIKKLIGDENLMRIACENPLRVLRNAYLLPMAKADPKTEVKKESKWRFW
jgi:protein-tyrosine phosphatase